MKTLILVCSIAIGLFFVGCGKNDPDKGREMLVVLNPSSSKLLELNPEDGTTTELLSIKLNGSPLTGLRSFYYDKASKKAFLGGSGNSGKLYSLDLATGEATVLNANANYNGANTLLWWYGITDMVMINGELLAHTYLGGSPDYVNIDAGGIVVFNPSTGAVVDHYPTRAISNSNSTCCGGGMALKNSDAIYLGNYWSNPSLATVNITGNKGDFTEVSLLTNDGATFVADYPNFGITSATLQAISEPIDGISYGILFDGETNGTTGDKYQFLVSINLTTGEIGYIALVADTFSGMMHGMNVANENAFK